MQVKALLLDFDGTLVQRDMLTEVIDLVGKKAESTALDEEFRLGKLPGVDGLVKRINLLQGASLSEIQVKIREDLALTEGAEELVEYCKQHEIITVLASGSIVPILEVYQQELGLDFIVGPQPKIVGDKIAGISHEDFPKEGNFKVVGIQSILQELGIHKAECVAVGDSRGDLPMFDMAAYAIAINPKIDLSEYSDETVTNLRQVRDIVKTLKRND